MKSYSKPVLESKVVSPYKVNKPQTALNKSATIDQNFRIQGSKTPNMYQNK